MSLTVAAKNDLLSVKYKERIGEFIKKVKRCMLITLDGYYKTSAVKQ